jgi:hypothetical protein
MSKLQNPSGSEAINRPIMAQMRVDSEHDLLCNFSLAGVACTAVSVMGFN